MRRFSNILIFTFLFLFFFLVLGPFLAPYDPLVTNPSGARMPPGTTHLLGTDSIGRDLLSRMLVGARLTVGMGVLATLFACTLGVVLGMTAGYFGGRVDLVISQLIDVGLAFPSLLLAIGISIVMEPGGLTVIIALTAAGWADFARLMRSQALILKNMDYVLSAKALGTSHFKILTRHLLPNAMSLIIVSASLKLGGFMLAEAGLSFLGLGIPAPYPTLGGMIAMGRDYLTVHPTISLFPGILIAGIVVTCNFLGEALQTRLDPKNHTE